MDAVLRRPDVQILAARHGRGLVADAVRAIIAAARRDAGPGPAGASALLDRLPERLEEAVLARTESSLRRVINATGIIIHTNLGRAVLSDEARARVVRVALGYSTLEYDLDRAERGSRSASIEARMGSLFPGCGALAVNNNAGAVFLALHTLAAGREVLISRGELVEIGGSFRIPDVMAAAGATLREVGTTNRTRRSDYEGAIGPATAMILKVHTSNYRILGFTQEAGVAELAELARARDLPLMIDQGSGILNDVSSAGIRDEPTVAALLGDGADLVSFSGDKALGGPQAGLLVGRRDLTARLRRSPLYRALRLDKMALAALEATLDAWVRGSERSEVPAQRMIFADPQELAARASGLAEAIAARLGSAFEVALAPGVSRVGGGAAPLQDLPTRVVSIRPASGSGPGASALEAALRRGPVPVIARLREEAVHLDPRTIDPMEESELVEAVASAALSVLRHGRDGG